MPSPRPLPLCSPALLACAAALLLAPPHAAPQMAGMPMDTTGAATPPDKLPPPLPMTGIGNVSLAISSRNPAVQTWFNQGLNLYFDFWDYESARAFEQAVRLDPQCAICYWGLSQAEGFRGDSSKPYARAALDHADVLKAHASREEKLYIQSAVEEEAAAEAAAKAVTGPKDEPDKTAEIATLRRAVRQFPRDTTARLLLAQALTDGFNDDGTPRKGQREAQSLIQGVLKQQPDNSAANHLWIHAVEAGNHPEMALHSAKILGALAPASGHMVHMPGHIFYRTGDYGRAQAAFTTSTATDEHYLHTAHVSIDDDWNYVHNLMYSIANLLEQGKLSEAAELSGKLTGARGHRPETLYLGSARDSIARIDPQLPVALRSGDYARAASLLKDHPQPPSLPNLTFLRNALESFADGMQALQNHADAQAESASTSLDAALWRMSEQVKSAEAAALKQKKSAHAASAPESQDARAKPLLANLAVMSLELRGGVLLAQHRVPQAGKLFAQAERQETELGYHEPPNYIRPVAETEAALLLSAGNLSDAHAAYQRALGERPGSGFPLYGLAQTSEDSGDTKEAVAAYTKFLAAWKDADPSLPQLTHAHAYLTEHQQSLAAK